MIFSAITAAYQAFSVGVTLLDGYQKGRDLLLGNTATVSLADLERRMSARFDRIDAHLGLSPVGEFDGLDWAPSPDVVTRSRLHRLQTDFGADLVQSRPAIAPKTFVQVFRENPERLLTQVTPLKGVDVDKSLLEDPTMVPVLFEKGGVYCIGWAKEAAISLSLGATYAPRIAQRPQLKPPEIRPGFPLSAASKNLGWWSQSTTPPPSTTAPTAEPKPDPAAWPPASIAEGLVALGGPLGYRRRLFGLPPRLTVEKMLEYYGYREADLKKSKAYGSLEAIQAANELHRYLASGGSIGSVVPGVAEIEKLAERSNAAAVAKLANMRQWGDGVRTDWQAARDLLENALKASRWYPLFGGRDLVPGLQLPPTYYVGLDELGYRELAFMRRKGTGGALDTAGADALEAEIAKVKGTRIWEMDPNTPLSLFPRPPYSV
ncbi:MAG: hypothetical protein AAGG56_14080 [Pseudomonadota bacterium]